MEARPEYRVWSEDEFASALVRARKERVIDASNVALSGERLDELLRATTEAEPRGPLLDSAEFAGTRFLDHAHFFNVEFRGKTNFKGATFTESVSFLRSSFHDYHVDFSGIRVTDWAAFDELMFAYLPETPSGSRSTPGVSFSDARFSSRTSFNNTVFPSWVSCLDVVFGGPSSWNRCHFPGDLWFDGARFADDVAMFSLSVAQRLSFRGARFEGARKLGPLFAGEVADFNRVFFEKPVSIGIGAKAVWLNDAVFDAGVNLFVESADIAAEEANFRGASLIADRGAAPDLLRAAREESRYSEESLTLLNKKMVGDAQAVIDQALRMLQGATPRLVSVRRSRLLNVTIAGVDLTPCRFADAHDVDALRLERVSFGHPPRALTCRHWPVKWTRRQVIAEEQQWRQSVGFDPRWYGADAQAPDWLGNASVIDSEQIEAIYRALRKGRELGKDEPGAGDFYYGEMEMRRRPLGRRAASQSAPSSLGERMILMVYWLVSGYGMRASRALACLAMTLAIGALLLSEGAFIGSPPAGGPTAFALESMISLLRAPDVRLTAYGQYITIVLRLLGPLFLGFALLALRGRVKR